MKFPNMKQTVFISLLSAVSVTLPYHLTAQSTSVKDETVTAEKCTIKVNADKILAKGNRADLLGLNIAVYHSPAEFRKAINGPLRDLLMGLIRIPGGSVSDKYYWNGNGVIRPDGTIDKSKFIRYKKQGYWKIDYSAYRPGFAVDNNDWSKIVPGFVQMDAKTMQDITREHPVARNLITVNLGTGKPEMAAEWVRWSNKKNNYGVKYWEFGNELNGTWEAGHIKADGNPITGEEYAERFLKFAKAMKAVDPTIKVGGPSCDVEHHDDFFTPLLEKAGDQVDFITFHYYSLRSSLAPEKDLFKGLKNLKPVMDKLHALVKKYLPERYDKIGYSITEWNSKLPKDQDAYRLFNGLWFSAWIGEMLKQGVTSATVWDIFSGKDNGHGLLVRHGSEYVPTGRYWAFWLWSHYMADTLVDSSVSGSDNLHVYTTKNKNTLYVMVMNQSRTDYYDAVLDIAGFKPAETGTEVTLSSREYFWNPYAFEADWNYGPSKKGIAAKNGMTVRIPPYCVKVFEFDTTKKAAVADSTSAHGQPELKLLLPDAEFCDMETEGWIRAYIPGTSKPYPYNMGIVKFKVDGPAEIITPKVLLSGASARFVLKPEGKPGTITITAECGGQTTSGKLTLKPVNFDEVTAWDFNNGKIKEPTSSNYKFEIAKSPAGNGKALKFSFPFKAESNHLIDIKQYPRGIPKARIGGVVFDLILPDSLQVKSAGADGKKFDTPTIQVVLQSTGAYWIPCGTVKLDKNAGKSQKIKIEIPDKKFLKVMDRAFSVIFLISGEQALSGDFYIDNLGFLLRPKK